MVLNPKAIVAVVILSAIGSAAADAQDSLLAIQVDGYFQIALTGTLAHAANIDTVYWRINKDDFDYCNASHMSVDMAMAVSHVVNLKFFSTCFIETDREDCREGLVFTARHLRLIFDHMTAYNQDIKYEELKVVCTKAIEYIEMILGHLNILFPDIDFSLDDTPDDGQ